MSNLNESWSGFELSFKFNHQILSKLINFELVQFLLRSERDFAKKLMLSFDVLESRPCLLPIKNNLFQTCSQAVSKHTLGLLPVYKWTSTK